MEYENSQGQLVNHSLQGVETLVEPEQPMETPAPAAPEAPQTTAAPEQGTDDLGDEQQGDEAPAGEVDQQQHVAQLDAELSALPVDKDLASTPAPEIDDDTGRLLEEIADAPANELGHLVSAGARITFQDHSFSASEGLAMMQSQGLTLNNQGYVFKAGAGSDPVGRLDIKTNAGTVQSARFIKF